ncbi:MAG: DUF4126 family protein [Bryobacteraceae bacterium]
MSDWQVYGGAAVLGAVSGMRSMAAPAIVSRFAHAGLLPLHDSQIKFLSHRNSAKTMAIAAIGEMVADKLPFIPNRTSVFPLVARAASGALSGTAFVRARRRSAVLGGLIGSLAAVAASYGAYKLRKAIGEKLHVPDLIVAVAEDALVAACGFALLRAVKAAEDAA